MKLNLWIGSALGLAFAAAPAWGFQTCIIGQAAVIGGRIQICNRSTSIAGTEWRSPTTDQLSVLQSFSSGNGSNLDKAASAYNASLGLTAQVRANDIKNQAELDESAAARARDRARFGKPVEFANLQSVVDGNQRKLEAYEKNQDCADLHGITRDDPLAVLNVNFSDGTEQVIVPLQMVTIDGNPKKIMLTFLNQPFTGPDAVQTRIVDNTKAPPQWSKMNGEAYPVQAAGMFSTVSPDDAAALFQSTGGSGDCWLADSVRKHGGVHGLLNPFTGKFRGGFQ